MTDVYQFDDLSIDVRRRIIQRRNDRLPVSDTSFRLLLALIQAAPGYLSTQRCLDEVWKGRIVGAETVSQRVRILRRALGDDTRAPRYIESARGLGYRLKSIPIRVEHAHRGRSTAWGTLLVVPPRGNGLPTVDEFVSSVAELVSATPWHVVPPEAFDLNLSSNRSLHEMIGRTGATHTLFSQVGGNHVVHSRVLNNRTLNLIAGIEIDAEEMSECSALSVARQVQSALWGDVMNGGAMQFDQASAWSAIVAAIRLLARPRPPTRQLLAGLQALTRETPDCAIGHALLANLMLKPHISRPRDEPDLTGARDHIEAALSLAPTNLTVHRLASMTTRLMGAHDEAAHHAATAAQSHLHLDELLAVMIGRGDLPGALEVARQLMRTHPPGTQFHGVGMPSHDYQPLLRVSCLMVLLDRWDDAHLWSQRLVAHFPHSSLALSVHANILAELGETVSARRHLRTLDRLMPGWKLEEAIDEWHKIYPADARIAARLYGGLEKALG